MRWAAKQYVDQHSFKEFNELLAVAYLTKNKMGVCLLTGFTSIISKCD